MLSSCASALPGCDPALLSAPSDSRARPPPQAAAVLCESPTALSLDLNNKS